MKIINLTPHAVQVMGPDGAVALDLAKPSEGAKIPRVSVSRQELPSMGLPVQVFKATFGALADLPEPVEGVLILVSALVRDAGKAVGRTDLVSPGELVRDAAGKPMGCRGLDA